MVSVLKKSHTNQIVIAFSEILFFSVFSSSKQFFVQYNFICLTLFAIAVFLGYWMLDSDCSFFVILSSDDQFCAGMVVMCQSWSRDKVTISLNAIAFSFSLLLFVGVVFAVILAVYKSYGLECGQNRQKTQ